MKRLTVVVVLLVCIGCDRKSPQTSGPDAVLVEHQRESIEHEYHRSMDLIQADYDKTMAGHHELVRRGVIDLVEFEKRLDAAMNRKRGACQMADEEAEAVIWPRGHIRSSHATNTNEC